MHTRRGLVPSYPSMCNATTPPPQTVPSRTRAGYHAGTWRTAQPSRRRGGAKYRYMAFLLLLLLLLSAHDEESWPRLAKLAGRNRDQVQWPPLLPHGLGFSLAPTASVPTHRTATEEEQEGGQADTGRLTSPQYPGSIASDFWRACLHQRIRGASPPRKTYGGNRSRGETLARRTCTSAYTCTQLVVSARTLPCLLLARTLRRRGTMGEDAIHSRRVAMRVATGVLTRTRGLRLSAAQLPCPALSRHGRRP